MDDKQSYLSNFKKLPAVDKTQLVLSAFIKLSLVLALIFAVVEKEWTTVFVCVIALLVTLFPLYLERNHRFYIPIGFEFIIVLFVCMTLFLGEVHGFYTHFWWWDIVLHTGSGLTFGFLGFLVLYSLHLNGKFQVSPSLIAFLAFSVSLATGVMWEIFEFSMDSLFGFNMQKSGHLDTMWDLIVNTFGAFVASSYGYIFMRHRKRGLGIFHYYLDSYLSRKKG